MISSHLQRLVEHMEWADARIWSAVLALETAHADAVTRERLHHVHTVQRVYLGIWTGEPMDPLDESEIPDLTSIRDWGREIHEGLSGFVGSLEREALDRVVDFPWADQLVDRWGEVGAVTVAESVLQVVSHTTHHRGQIGARLRRLGGDPPLADFVAWLWQGRPDSRWP